MDNMRYTFTNKMKILTLGLKKYTKKGVYSYLDEAFVRFNFNSFYLSRDEEGLEWKV